LPSSYKLRVRLSTALDNGVSVFVDDLALAEATRFYTGGPYVAAFAASVNPALEDHWTVAITSTLGGFQKLFERFFGMRQLGLTLPFSSTPTISDSLVT